MADLAGKRTLEKNKVEQRIDLSEFSDVELGEFQKLQVGQALIDRIVERSESGRDVNGKRFPAYSKEYKQSEDFERYGKTPSERDMTLRGNMLEGIDLEISGNDLVIKMEDDQAPKAHGNITGQEGKWGYERDFFGVTDRDVRKALRDNVEVSQEERFDILQLIDVQRREQSARSVFDNLFFSILNNRSGNGEG